MEPFDHEGNIKSILEGIQKTETFYSAFSEEFSQAIFDIIHKHYPKTVKDGEIENLLVLYAVAILNSTESVIDKDRTYPLYRLEEDLQAMSKMIQLFQRNFFPNNMELQIHMKAKELAVKHFKAVFDLSAIGFRLLEKNTRAYNLEFAGNLKRQLSEAGLI